MTRFLSPKEVCDLIGQNYQWLYKARKTPGKGPPAYRIGGKYIYRKEDVDGWFDKQRVG